MCGILAAFGLTGDAETNRRKVLKQSKKLRHRGPDQTGVWTADMGNNGSAKQCWLVHERLIIVDTTDAGK